jgi:hypothetical protein
MGGDGAILPARAGLRRLRMNPSRGLPTSTPWRRAALRAGRDGTGQLERGSLDRAEVGAAGPPAPRRAPYRLADSSRTGGCMASSTRQQVRRRTTWPRA